MDGSHCVVMVTSFNHCFTNAAAGKKKVRISTSRPAPWAFTNIDQLFKPASILVASEGYILRIRSVFF